MKKLSNQPPEELLIEGARIRKGSEQRVGQIAEHYRTLQKHVREALTLRQQAEIQLREMSRLDSELQELVRQGVTLREDEEREILKLGEVYKALHERARRSPETDDTPIYLMLSTVGQRFASMVLQGVRRVEPLERKLVGMSERRKQEVAQEEQRILRDLREAKKATKLAERERIEPVSCLSDNDFLSLYGEDFE